MLGGLRPGTTDPITAELRDEILHHWHQVQNMTGQPFEFEGAMPDGFIYNTEPPSRAVVSVAECNAEQTLRYFKLVQQAFYANQRDVTKLDVLAQLAEEVGVEEPKFLSTFKSVEAQQKTQTHFNTAKQIGVRGFPSVFLQHQENYSLLTHGYRHYAELEPVIEQWLEKIL